jgi:hypothetical protein
VRYRDIEQPTFISRVAHNLKQLARWLDPRRESNKRDDNDPWNSGPPGNENLLLPPH